jgi:hypothetical protein
MVIDDNSLADLSLKDGRPMNDFIVRWDKK